MTFEEFLPIYSQVKKEKEAGAFEDFMEGLKVYDKAENGTMLAGELAHVLLSLGTSIVSKKTFINTFESDLYRVYRRKTH